VRECVSACVRDRERQSETAREREMYIYRERNTTPARPPPTLLPLLFAVGLDLI